MFDKKYTKQYIIAIILVKSDEEYTSTIAKIFKVTDEFIIMTENSIYIVDNKIQLRRIST